jgi:hypothetical protein
MSFSVIRRWITCALYGTVHRNNRSVSDIGQRVSCDTNGTTAADFWARAGISPPVTTGCRPRADAEHSLADAERTVLLENYEPEEDLWGS